MKHKDDTVAANVNGVAFLFKKNKIDSFIGVGEIKKAGVVEVTADDGARQSLVTKNIVIATGSDVAPLPGLEIDEKQVVSSTGALSLGKVPGKIVIVGAGVIGLELGSVWRRLGAKCLSSNSSTTFSARWMAKSANNSSGCSKSRDSNSCSATRSTKPTRRG